MYFIVLLHKECTQAANQYDFIVLPFKMPFVMLTVITELGWSIILPPNGVMFTVFTRKVHMLCLQVESFRKLRVYEVWHIC